MPLPIFPYASTLEPFAGENKGGLYFKEADKILSSDLKAFYFTYLPSVKYSAVLGNLLCTWK
jgi:hypothetical protein